MNVGIGIITRNRREVFLETYRRILQNRPNGCPVYVVDDCSDVPAPFATERLPENKGVAGATNALLRHMDSHDHLFLFNDDCYPVSPGWWRPYIRSGYSHLSLSFEFNAAGRRLSRSVYVKEKKRDIWVYNAPNGCMLYVRRECLEAVGGMDERFGIWGHEHVEWSLRIHNAGLTPHPFMDVPGAIRMFRSLDYYGTVRSSVPTSVRVEHIQKNESLLTSLKGSARYVPYK